MLHIHTSNRLEYLVQALVNVIKANPQPPLIQETIVVQSKGMERWVSMELAKQLGVWANGYFPFANAMLWRLFKETLGYLPDTSLFEREVMVWSLMEILPEFLENQEFIEIINYLQGDEQHIKRFQLASRIADVFDQYLMYRPTWIADWENGVQPRELENDSQARWQAILWRALVKRYGTQHRAKLRADFFRNVQCLANNPRFRRVSVFGISALPPFHLEVLAELGRVIDVYIFLLIEEPEAHLHPYAQIAVMKMLAYLVNQGFHLVITTHSLFVLYALNNLTMAHQKLGYQKVKNMPKPHIRIAPSKMGAYLFAEGSVKNIIDKPGHINESLLEQVLGDLEVEYNKLLTYKVLWG